MKFRKIIALLVVVLSLSLSLAGCMREETGDSVVPSPSATADFLPGNTDAPNQKADNGTSAAFDWSTRVGEVEAEITQLSEIDEAKVIVNGSTALVGVRFSPQYKGEMTERIREMVASAVMKADASISTVAVTASENDVQEIFDMAGRMAEGAVEDLENEVQRIVRNATTLR